MTGPSPLPPAAGTAHPLEVIYIEMCRARLWTSHYDIPDIPDLTSEETPVADEESRTPDTDLNEPRDFPAVFEDDQPPPESERSPFAADEDPEPLSHMGAEEA